MVHATGRQPATWSHNLLWRSAVITSLGVAPLSCDTVSESGSAPGPVELLAADVHIIGTSENIATVNDLEVLSDGSVWVLNSTEPFFIGFSPEGDVAASHGAEGGGPEEFRLPSAFVTGGWEGGAWVLDLRRHSLIEISDVGADWSEFRLPRGPVPPGSVIGGGDMTSLAVRTGRLGREIVLPRTRGSLADGLSSFRLAILGADLVAFDPESDSVRTVVALGETLADPSVGFVATEGGFPLWYRLWAVCGEDQLRVYDRARNQVRGFDGSGNELDPIALPPVQLTEVTPRQFARTVFALRQAEVTGGVGPRLSAADSSRLLNEMVQGITGEPHELANYLPRYVDLRCADDGTVWMRPFDVDVGGLAGGRTWLRIAPGGAQRDVVLPERFDALRFSPDRVWGVQRDELDVASIAWIALPGSPTSVPTP